MVAGLRKPTCRGSASAHRVVEIGQWRKSGKRVDPPQAETSPSGTCHMLPTTKNPNPKRKVGQPTLAETFKKARKKKKQPAEGEAAGAA